MLATVKSGERWDTHCLFVVISSLNVSRARFGWYCTVHNFKGHSEKTTKKENDTRRKVHRYSVTKQFCDTVEEKGCMRISKYEIRMHNRFDI